MFAANIRGRHGKTTDRISQLNKYRGVGWYGGSSDLSREARYASRYISMRHGQMDGTYIPCKSVNNNRAPRVEHCMVGQCTKAAVASAPIHR